MHSVYWSDIFKLLWLFQILSISIVGCDNKYFGRRVSVQKTSDVWSQHCCFLCFYLKNKTDRADACNWYDSDIFFSSRASSCTDKLDVNSIQKVYPYFLIICLIRKYRFLSNIYRLLKYTYKISKMNWNRSDRRLSVDSPTHILSALLCDPPIRVYDRCLAHSLHTRALSLSRTAFQFYYCFWIDFKYFQAFLF